MRFVRGRWKQLASLPLWSLLGATCVAWGTSASRVQAQSWKSDATHVGTTARVLIVGARPEDEDNALIAWLSLGRHVETAYLSLTRGESGENVSGGELGAPLAVVRTAELLEERRRDRARQFFTRAYDFGFTEEDSVVDRAWPNDSLLRDVVSVVRAFRPHVVISLIDTTGVEDAAHRRAARLAWQAYTMAGDSARLAPAATGRLPVWSLSRLLTRISPGRSTLAPLVVLNVGEFDRATGRS
ncbi:MAG: PIG-L family deacetylase, partial [Cytophagaceae bacterium]|nr:PIG-L family deacetylase [Gemmatimonadaceae bacterium]